MKLQLSDENRYVMEGIYFGHIPDFEEFIKTKDTISVTYYPEINSYQGRDSLQIVIQNYC